MAIKFGFFDASYDEQTGEYDRQYFSDDMSKLFSVITGNGVFKNDRNALEVVTSGLGMSVAVGTGFAIARGRYIDNTESYVLQLSAPSSLSKIDMIVARMSTLSNERNFQLIVKEGTPSSSPEPPELTRNEAVYEMCLAKVTIDSNTTVITSSMIEDTRDNEELCGFVSGLGGGAEFISCIINTEADLYSSAWLKDSKKGTIIQPEPKKVYMVTTSGTYENCIYVFDVSANKYVGVGSYNIELSDEEVLDLWDSSSHVRLENIPAPVSVLQYNGQVQSPTWLYYDPTKVRIGGITSAVNVGNYYATFEPINGYSWPDGSVTVKSIMWTINKKFVPIPIPVQTQFNYDGTTKTVVFNNLDTLSVTITNASAINTGVYSVTATLNDPLNCSWQDDTIVQKAWSYAIAGMQNIVTLSKSSVTLNSDSDYDTVVVSSSSGGAITVESTNENIVHAEVNGSVITLTPGPAVFKGTASVLVIVAGSSIYEPGVASISVSKNYGVDIVSWADGTDAEIVGMVQAADRGEIDLRDYWHVGDERTVRLSAIPASGSNDYGIWDVPDSHIAQDVTLVLMDTNKYELVTPVLDKNKNTRNKCSFVVGLKNALIEPGRIWLNDRVITWNYNDKGYRHAWLNRAFAGAIPSTLIDMFKTFKVISATAQNSTELTVTEDLFSLFAAREVFDTYDGYMSTEQEWNANSQIEYYKTAANRQKVVGGSNVGWWTRSVQKNNSDYGSDFTSVSTAGGHIRTEPSANLSIAPFGVI